MRASDPAIGNALWHVGCTLFSGVSALMIFGSVAQGFPRVGEGRAAVRLGDAWGRTLDLASVERPMLVVYEDRGSAHENERFKKELATLAADGRYEARVVLVAVADLTAYDFWPARRIVEHAIKDESRKYGTAIYCDWDGRFRRALHLQPGVSNIVLYGRNGEVLFAHAGPLSTEDRERVLASIPELLK